ncbi:alpha-mannosidase [Heterostelium album PN500]|uniref:alpha-mannosidase n=1 Tax=Heterostelium pallidum (strain ATCC 26659 / Pp 5 / PN500) TaxID=670386 RepID=D3BEN7_HETP5|nr:alpha-mannosidase [Heterostelium album PN500]EFA80368.1 alpha-mannosidase [Heterostelium album PN500]|eukprot:XP_020432488.1 alpha-mannosidase [Heterostelium album PN500]
MTTAVPPTRNIVVERVEKFISDTYFTDVNIKGRIYTHFEPSAVQLQVSERCDRIPYRDALNLKYEACTVGRSFGPSWATYWFKLDIEVPSTMKGKEVHLLWNSNSEALIWRDGVPIQGLTGGTWVDKRIEFKLTNNSSGNEKYHLMVEMACNGMFGVGKDGLINPCDPDKTFALSKCELAVFDNECYQLYTYFTMLYDIAKNFPEGSLRSNQALYVANNMINYCDINARETWAPCIKMAKEFFSQKNGDSQHSVLATGHCHIDVAWLWPYAETKRKAARSFATQILYMDYYPDYQFVQSQAQLYSWTKQLYPELYDKIKQKVKSGQFVTTGGTWVEMDGNLPSGESFIRQFLFGQRFFKQEFGAYCTEFWLPDTFGYSGQLPQVIRHMGIANFITQKLSWNNINKFPHSSFHWEGIDGSRVLCHFPPANTYNSAADVKEVVLSMTNNKDAQRANNSLLVYGHGDGGGGPTIEMLERLTKMPNTDGIPKVTLGSPRDFFERLQVDAHKLNAWVGELYFELHRGTYTSQANCKRGNRKCEFLLHDVEAVSTILDANRVESFKYPNLNEQWELLLLNQFHDVLPGSSIGLVYKDAAEHHKKIESDCIQHLNGSLGLLGSATGTDVLFFNPTGFTVEKVIELPINTIPTPQISSSGKSLALIKVPAYGFTKMSATAMTSSLSSSAVLSTVQLTVKIDESNSDHYQISNSFISLSIKKDGTISSLVDRALNRQVIVPGQFGNRFVLYDDIPLFWDAWDVEIYSQEKSKLAGPATSSRVLESGPLRVIVEFEHANFAHQSTLKQRVIMYANTSRVDFETNIEWHEAHKMLKVEFPTTLRATTASYDIQFGHVQRPTHFNTSWDVAKFEVCGHKWADLSEYDFGLALLNDCKYGYSVHSGVMKLSLLRAPKAPDADADMGSHQFTYSLYVHKGNLQQGDVVAQGYQVNCNLYSQLVDADYQILPTLISVAGSNSAVLETIKRAEDNNGYIVRVYESFGGHTNFHFVSDLSIKNIQEVNGLEEPITPTTQIKLNTKVGLTPFQLKSFRIQL